jgi:hypothetical protein
MYIILWSAEDEYENGVTYVLLVGDDRAADPLCGASRRGFSQHVQVEVVCPYIFVVLDT